MDMPLSEGTLPAPRRRRWPLALGAAILGIVGFILWPSPIDPIAWEVPPSMPFEGALALNSVLAEASIKGKGAFIGPEDVDVDDEGRIVAGVVDGRLIHVDAKGNVQTWVSDLGRPIGMDFDSEGNLVVCDPKKGLLSVDRSGKAKVLVPADGVPKLGFLDDCEIASDGMIYFSDASEKFGIDSYMNDLLEGRPHGKLLVHDPKAGTTKVLLDKLYFANGVAVAPDDSFVLVNETYRFRVMRYWLKGEKAGTADVFIEHLPGYPDGISSSPRGTFWIALFTTRNPMADRLAGLPWVRAQMAKLPAFFLPKPADYGLAIEVGLDGKPIRSLHDATGQHVANVTSVHEENGMLYFGNLLKDYLAVLPLPAETAK